MSRLKALFFTLWLYSFLFWVYIAGRIVIDEVPVDSPFLNSTPNVSFVELGALSFVVGMVFMYLYLIEK